MLQLNVNNKITIPAEIDPEIAKQIKKVAIQSCRALNIFGFARVDFFLEKQNVFEKTCFVEQNFMSSKQFFEKCFSKNISQKIFFENRFSKHIVR